MPTTIKYWNDSSVSNCKYGGYIKEGMEKWYYPRTNNGSGSYCTPYNNFYYYNSSWTNSIIDFYVVSDTRDALGWTEFYTQSGARITYPENNNGYYSEIYPNVKSGQFGSLSNTSTSAKSKQNTIAHEIGHALGLAHPYSYNSSYAGETIMAQTWYR